MKFKLHEWKKVSHGDNHTTLRNEDGHELKIFHKKLSPHLKKQLSGLPMALETAAASTEPMMAAGGNVGEQRTEIFGDKGDPGKKSKKGKAQMEALMKLAAQRYGMPVVPSQGKIDETTGKRKDFDPKQVGGKLKPDWRSGQLESQMNPQAIAHELAHLEISPEGVGMPDLQRGMDKTYSEVASQFGGRQKQTQGEIQPMALENAIRRRAGLPPFARPQYSNPAEGKSKESLSMDSPERIALDTGKPYAQRLQDPKTQDVYDLIGLMRNLSPENRAKLQAVDEGSMKFDPQQGWQKASTPNALINMRGRGEGDEATRRAKQMGVQPARQLPLLAQGGQVPQSDHEETAAEAFARGFNAALGTQPKPTPSPSPAAPQSFAEGTPDMPVQAAPPVQDVDLDAQPLPSPETPQTPVYDEPAGPSAPPALDPEVARKREIYNDVERGKAVTGGMGNPNPGQSSAADSLGRTFGPNGEAPSDFHVPSWIEAEKLYAAEQSSKALADKVAAQKQRVVDTAKMNAGLPPSAGAAMAPGEPASGAAAPVQPPSVTTSAADSDPMGVGAYMQAFTKGANEKLGGLQGEATAYGKLGQQEAAVQQQAVGQQQQMMSTYQKHLSDLDNERQNLIQDIKDQHIDPNHLFASEGTGGRLATGIGLILGGIGATKRGSNPALDFLNKQIDRDIEAQKLNMGKSENLLAMNMRQYGNLRDATDATRLQLQSVVGYQLGQAASSAKGPLAQANAEKAAGDLYMTGIAPAMQQMAARRMFSNMFQGNQSNGSKPAADGMGSMIAMLHAMGQHDLAKSYEERYVPGVGTASIPLSQANRDRLMAHDTFNKAASNLYNWSSQHSGSLNPKDQATGQEMAAELQSMYRDAINGGVFKKGEQEYIDNIIDSKPYKFFNNIRVLPKLRSAIESNKMKESVMRRQVGLPQRPVIKELP